MVGFDWIGILESWSKSCVLANLLGVRGHFSDVVRTPVSLLTVFVV